VILVSTICDIGIYYFEMIFEFWDDILMSRNDIEVVYLGINIVVSG
jgi:hypothetical protein